MELGEVHRELDGAYQLSQNCYVYTNYTNKPKSTTELKNCTQPVISQIYPMNLKINNFIRKTDVCIPA